MLGLRIYLEYTKNDDVQHEIHLIEMDKSPQETLNRPISVMRM